MDSKSSGSTRSLTYMILVCFTLCHFHHKSVVYLVIYHVLFKPNIFIAANYMKYRSLNQIMNF